MKISIVIGTFNQKEVLQKTLLSLFGQTLPPDQYEIQLVDSFSSDGTDRMVEGLKPTCDLNYQRVENKGKTFARNLGIKAARGEIVLITDADMAADKNFLAIHLDAQLKFKASAFEGKTINPDGKPYITARLRPWQKIKWSYFLTGNLSIPKELITRAGLFDEAFKGYGWEDIELGYRLHKMRVPLRYLPAAVNYHNHPVSNEDMVKRKFEMGRSAAYFYKNHPDLEIRFFLGMNPLAMGIYSFLKRHPALIEKIESRAKKSSFFRYLREEYAYRSGLEKG